MKASLLHSKKTKEKNKMNHCVKVVNDMYDNDYGIFYVDNEQVEDFVESCFSWNEEWNEFGETEIEELESKEIYSRYDYIFMKAVEEGYRIKLDGLYTEVDLNQ
jgi:hypothetical protein